MSVRLVVAKATNALRKASSCQEDTPNVEKLVRNFTNNMSPHSEFYDFSLLVFLLFGSRCYVVLVCQRWFCFVVNLCKISLTRNSVHWMTYRQFIIIGCFMQSQWQYQASQCVRLVWGVSKTKEKRKCLISLLFLTSRADIHPVISPFPFSYIVKSSWFINISYTSIYPKFVRFTIVIRYVLDSRMLGSRLSTWKLCETEWTVTIFEIHCTLKWHLCASSICEWWIGVQTINWMDVK